MRQFLKSFLTISALSAVALVSVAPSASAQEVEAKGLQGSYIGVGVGTGVPSTVKNGELTGTFTGRINFNESNFSLRPNVVIGADTGSVGFLGTVTYDAAVAQNTNLYFGLGAAAAKDYGSLALQAGAEKALGESVVLFGDVTYLTEKGEWPWKVGLGYRF